MLTEQEFKTRYYENLKELVRHRRKRFRILKILLSIIGVYFSFLFIYFFIGHPYISDKEYNYLFYISFAVITIASVIIDRQFKILFTPVIEQILGSLGSFKLTRYQRIDSDIFLSSRIHRRSFNTKIVEKITGLADGIAVKFWVSKTDWDTDEKYTLFIQASAKTLFEGEVLIFSKNISLSEELQSANAQLNEYQDTDSHTFCQYFKVYSRFEKDAEWLLSSEQARIIFNFHIAIHSSLAVSFVDGYVYIKYYIENSLIERLKNSKFEFDDIEHIFISYKNAADLAMALA